MRVTQAEGDIMSRVRFDLNKAVTIQEFTKALQGTTINYEIDDGPSNFYPYFRLWFGDVKMVALTNGSGNVVRLVPVDDLVERHGQLADWIAGELDTTIRVEDFTNWGSGLKWARAIWEKQQHEDTAERYGFR